MKKSIRSAVATLANHLYYSTTLNQSQAWKKAWAVVKLKKAMSEKEAVEFAFTKVSGEERRAVGTLHPSIVPATKGTGKQKPSHIVTYFDLDRNAWRSFRADSIKAA
jgi:hypothetical protein